MIFIVIVIIVFISGKIRDLFKINQKQLCRKVLMFVLFSMVLSLVFETLFEKQKLHSTYSYSYSYFLLFLLSLLILFFLKKQETG